MAFQWAKVGGNGAQRAPGRFNSPGGRRYPRGGVWRRLLLPSLFEALVRIVPAARSEELFSPTAKISNSQLHGNQWRARCSAQRETPRGGWKTDLSLGRAPGAPAATCPAPETPRGSGGRGARPSADAGPPGARVPSTRPRAAGAPWWRARRGGARPSGRPGVPDRRAGTEDGGRRPAGSRRAGLGSASHPGGGDRGSPSRRPGSDGPLPSPFGADRGGEARARGSRGGTGAAEKRVGGGGAGRRDESSSTRQPEPIGLAPRPGAPAHPVRATHPTLAALVPARVGVGPVHGERRVAARHLGAGAGNFAVSWGRRAASCRPCSGRPGAAAEREEEAAAAGPPADSRHRQAALRRRRGGGEGAGRARRLRPLLSPPPPVPAPCAAARRPEPSPGVTPLLPPSLKLNSAPSHTALFSFKR